MGPMSRIQATLSLAEKEGLNHVRRRSHPKRSQWKDFVAHYESCDQGVYRPTICSPGKANWQNFSVTLPFFHIVLHIDFSPLTTYLTPLSMLVGPASGVKEDTCIPSAASLRTL